MDKEQLLTDFLKYIMEAHTDEYGHILLVEDGDELDPTYERVIKEFLDNQ